MSLEEFFARLSAFHPGLPLILFMPFVLLVMYLTLAWIRARSTVDRQIATLDRQVNEKARIPKPEGEQHGSITRVWEEHFNRQQQYILVNLRQNQGVFLLAIAMIVFGLLLICIGLIWDFPHSDRPNQSLPVEGSWAAIIAGLFTQFVAGTILVVFKSVFQQTTEYYKSVERMASIGIAMNMLDALPTNSAELKTKILAEAANVVLERQLGLPTTVGSAPGRNTGGK